MLVGIITLVGAMVLSYLLIGGIVLSLSLNKRFVRWYSKKAIGLVGDIMGSMTKDMSEMMQKLDSVEQE